MDALIYGINNTDILRIGDISNIQCLNKDFFKKVEKEINEAEILTFNNPFFLLKR